MLTSLVPWLPFIGCGLALSTIRIEHHVIRRSRRILSAHARQEAAIVNEIRRNVRRLSP